MTTLRCRARRANSRFALVLCAITITPAAGAQPDSPRWGRIPDEDLAMTVYSADSAAAAVVLADVGRTTFETADGGFRIAFQRHRRVKVLSEAGYDLGTVVLRFDGDGQERVNRVRGQTFLPTPGGAPRRVELDASEVFTSAAGEGMREVRFTLPALQPGAVFEFSYELTSPDIVILPRWYFQDRVPTRYSAFEVELPTYFGYATMTEGMHRIEPGEQASQSLELGDMRRFWWIGRDLPALVEEPFVSHLPDHLQQMQMQLQTILDPEFGFTEGFLRTWEDLATALVSHPRFGGRLSAGRRVREEAERLAATHADPDERLRGAYDFVRTSVTWDRNYRLFAERNVDDVLEAGQGTSAEVNLLLVALLRRMGVEATPILVSTRSHGRSFPHYPLLSQFNHVVVLAGLDSGPLLLDATDPVLPAGLLPVETLAGLGWRVDEADPRWITFQPLDRTGTVAHVVGALSPDGEVAGRLNLRMTGYAAGQARLKLRAGDSAGPRDATAEAAAATDEIELDSVAVTHAADAYEPLEIEATLRVPAGAEAIGDRLFLSPVLLLRRRENPFGLPDRTYPVEFGHPFSETYSAQIEIPEGYEVETLPTPVSWSLPAADGGGRAARYARSVTARGQSLLVQMRFEVSTPTFQPAEYRALRALFDDIVAADAEPVVLRPATSATSEGAPAADVGREE